MPTSLFPNCALSNEEALYHLLKKEHEYYKTILQITKKEHEQLLSHMHPGQLQPLLNKKKMLLLNIHSLDKIKSPLITPKEKSIDQEFSHKITKELDKIKQVLEQIFVLDEKNKDLLHKEQLLLKKQIQNPHFS